MNKEHAKKFIPLRTKLLLQNALTIALIILFLSTFFYSYSASSITDKNDQFFQSISQQTASNLDNLFLGIEDGSRFLLFHDSIKSILRRGQSDNYSLSQQIADYYSLSRLLTENIWNKNIGSIRLYCNSNAIYTREELNIFDMQDIQETEWCKLTESLQGTPIWYAENGTIFYSCAIIDLYSQDRVLGILQIFIDLDQLNTILNSLNDTCQGEAALLSADNQIVMCLGKSPQVIQDYLQSSKNNGVSPSRASGISQMFQNRKLMTLKLNNEWKLVTTVSESIFYHDFLSLTLRIMGLTCGIMALAGISTYFFIKHLTNRIEGISEFIKTVEIRSNSLLKEDGNDELTSLQSSFNQMLTALRRSIAEEEKAIQEKNNAEYNILQEQINPHFLYNCLDSINWMALEQHSDNIAKMARLLGRFYRLTLSGGQHLVSLKQEIEHSKIYVEIMQTRFDGTLEVEYQIDDDLLSLTVPKLILQPLLENAIQHGISQKESQSGKIRVAVFRKENTLFLEVTDTGAGMTPQQSALVNVSIQDPSEKIGYGLRNVNQRIRYVFGERSGLFLRSVFGRGTKVTIQCHFSDESVPTAQSSTTFRRPPLPL